jgi:predicted aldo/keto reductase-like oxidoreductase
MSTITRRDFMRRTAGVVAAGSAATLTSCKTMPVDGSAKLEATSMRRLGKTGISTTLVAMGTGVRAWNGQSEMTRKGRPAFVGLLQHGYEKGIRFYDLADMYGSHDYMRDALKQGIPREKVTILTKSVSREAELMKHDLERFRKELDTDYVDIVLMHCQTEPGWTKNHRAAMDVMEEAKQQGKIKAHGVSCHNYECMVEASKDPWVDVILARFNPFQIKMDNTPDVIAQVLRDCKAADKGVLGMKIIGEGALADANEKTALSDYGKSIIGNAPVKDRLDQSLRFLFGTGCVDAFTIGFTEPQHVDDLISRISAINA